MKLAMVRLYNSLAERKLSTRVLLQVHDEIILEAPLEEVAAVEGMVRDVMEHVTDHPIPLSVHCESGESWGDFH